MVLYFVIAGNIFAHRLGLNCWLLWFVMNNDFILFYLLPVTMAFVVVWALAGSVSYVSNYAEMDAVTPFPLPSKLRSLREAPEGLEEDSRYGSA